jgi:hypothetical protein
MEAAVEPVVGQVVQQVEGPLDGAGRYRELHHKYIQAARNARKLSKSRKEQEESEDENSRKAGEDGDSLLPCHVHRSIAEHQVHAVQQIIDQFEGMHHIYRSTTGAGAMVVPYSETSIQPFFYSSRPLSHKVRHSPAVVSPKHAQGQTSPTSPQSGRRKGLTFIPTKPSSANANAEAMLTSPPPFARAPQQERRTQPDDSGIDQSDENKEKVAAVKGIADSYID